MTTKLIKYVAKVEIKYNPFDIRSTPAREVLRQLQTERMSKSNPKFQAISELVATPSPPVIDFKFVDGSQKTIFIQTPKQHAREIMTEMWEHAYKIDFDYEVNNKELDA